MAAISAPRAGPGLTINLNTGWATAGTWRCRLSRREAELLYALVGRAPDNAPSDYLAAQVYGTAGTEKAEETIRVFISFLRKRLKGSGYEIVNDRGYGYALRAIVNTPRV